VLTPVGTALVSTVCGGAPCTARWQTPKRIPWRRASSRASSLALGPVALRPGTTSSSWLCPALTSTIEVHQA
jgi:hypothetical protein